MYFKIRGKVAPNNLQLPWQKKQVNISQSQTVTLQKQKGSSGPDFLLIIWMLNIFQSWYFFRIFDTLYLFVLVCWKTLAVTALRLVLQAGIRYHCHVKCCAECTVNKHCKNKWRMSASVNSRVRIKCPIFGKLWDFTEITVMC